MHEKKILIVDDERDFVLVLSAHLQAHGYNVISASDAGDAIAAVQTEKPDLIILDISMPALDGLTVLKRLNKLGHTRSIRIIVVTGVKPEAKAEAIAAGATEFHLKPVNIDLLLDCIHKQFLQMAETAGGR